MNKSKKQKHKKKNAHGTQNANANVRGNNNATNAALCVWSQHCVDLVFLVLKWTG